jgi:hypothetical protein
MSDVSGVVIGVVSVLGAVAAVTWFARSSEFRSASAVPHERPLSYGPSGAASSIGCAPSRTRECRTGYTSDDHSQRGRTATPRTERRSYYDTARLSHTNAHMQSQPPLGVDRPTYFLQYSALGQELGPFTAAEKARLMASTNSARTVPWRQHDGLAAPRLEQLENNVTVVGD